MSSPFASWMDRYVIELPGKAPEKDPEDPFMSMLQQKGYAHEAALEDKFRAQQLSVTKIAGASSEEKLNQTLAAMREGINIIVQARLQDDQFSGYADFLVKVSGNSELGDYHYEVWDTKLARKTKPTFVIQLCCYAEMLESVQGRRSDNITIALGSGEEETFRTSDYFHYYKNLKHNFLSGQQNFDPDIKPDPMDSRSWGDWSEHAESILEESDHLIQVATITRSQIKRLNQNGIETMQQLVDSSLTTIPKLNANVFQRLKAQATIQKASAGQSVPNFEILLPADGEKTGLALLPLQSSLDVFFDIEGYPLDEGGLEYLWGNTYFSENGERKFRDFWAHNREQEEQAFSEFINWVYERWQRDPEMHIYHYANYEIAACRKLMGRYGACEYEVDQLLRNEVFVDLYKVVKGGVLIGEPRYSLKNVEHLYRGERGTEVGSGVDSVVVYEQWCDLHAAGEQGDTWQTSGILNDIRDYNIDDCDSTQELVYWLRDQQTKHGIAYLGKTDVLEPEVKDEISARTQLRDRLLQQAQQYPEQETSTKALTENLAWVLEFHRREAKPVFWRLFDRLGLAHEELLDDLDCLALCKRTKRAAFKHKPKARNLSYEYYFDPAQEFKGASKSFYLLGVEKEDGKNAKVTYIAEESDLDNGLITLQTKLEPPQVITLVPDEYVGPDPIPHSIDQVVADHESGQLKRCAIIDFLVRSKPAFKVHRSGPIAPSTEPNERLQQIIKAVQDLDNSYLTIQGPPGSGKTYTAKHVIAELVKSGARVGVTSNSHRAINNLLLSTALYCDEENIPASFICTRDTEPELGKAGISILKNAQLASKVEPACVIGTTAWGFARDDMAGELDYLFIDEAGQVAIANLIAMSRSAKNLVIMGDQMQLGQPSQGTHPVESGLSILDYLLHDSPTISDEMGVFLGTTYRMHSEINQFISQHIYEGKLEAHPDNDKRIIEVPENYRGLLNKSAGIIFCAVDHEGNTQASDEEVGEILSMAKELLGRKLIEISGESRPITWNDMLFVAPYNHQVSKLKQALGEQAKVGSVDKFQGQEAPIIFLSMCASDASESPRGLDFLFDRRRLNVAISRAQSLVIIVGNPGVGNVAVSRVEQLKLVNLFNALCSEGQRE